MTKYDKSFKWRVRGWKPGDENILRHERLVERPAFGADKEKPSLREIQASEQVNKRASSDLISKLIG